MKSERLLAILMMLVNRKRVTAAQLAEYFEVTPRTIYRDIEAICQAGVPIVAYQGKSGGFEIMDGYKIDRSVIKPDEMYSIITTLAGVNRAIRDRKVQDLTEKMQALMPRKDLDQLRGNRTLVLDFRLWGDQKRVAPKLALIRTAIETGRLVKFRYTDGSGAQTMRIVEPMTIVLKEFIWYLYGYCRLREDFRIFRVARIGNLEISDEEFVRRDQDLDEFPWDRPSKAVVRRPTVRMRFTPQARERAEELFGADLVRYCDDGSLLVEVGYDLDEWVYGMILSFGPEVEVLEPPTLRRLVAERVRKTSKLYGDV